MSHPNLGTSGPLSVFLVRHGESTGNQEACLQGSRIGGALSERGRTQSTVTAIYLFEAFEELRHGDVLLVSSPSTRALQTASPIAERLGCKIEIDDGLSELDFGDWSGMPVARLETDQAYLNWKKDPLLSSPPRGESFARMRSRIWQAYSRFVAVAETTRQPLVLVTHFFPLMALFELLLPGTAVRCDNASISRLVKQDGTWSATHLNEIAHLTAVAPTPVRYV